MSNPAAPMLFGVFLVLYGLAKYWKSILLAIFAVVITVLLLGVSQLVSIVKGQVAIEVVENPAPRN